MSEIIWLWTRTGFSVRYCCLDGAIFVSYILQQNSYSRGGGKGGVRSLIPRKKLSIPSVPIVKTTHSRLPDLNDNPGFPFPSGKELCSQNPGSFLREKCLIPEFPIFPEPPYFPPPFNLPRLWASFNFISWIWSIAFFFLSWKVRYSAITSLVNWMRCLAPVVPGPLNVPTTSFVKSLA